MNKLFTLISLVIMTILVGLSIFTGYYVNDLEKKTKEVLSQTTSAEGRWSKDTIVPIPTP